MVVEQRRNGNILSIHVNPFVVQRVLVTESLQVIHCSNDQENKYEVTVEGTCKHTRHIPVIAHTLIILGVNVSFILWDTGWYMKRRACDIDTSKRLNMTCCICRLIKIIALPIWWATTKSTNIRHGFDSAIKTVWVFSKNFCKANWQRSNSW